MIIALERSAQVLDDNGFLTLRAASFFEETARAINLNTPIIGVGSPEGVIDAYPTQMYMDTTGAAGSVLYIKQSGVGKTGWKLV